MSTLTQKCLKILTLSENSLEFSARPPMTLFEIKYFSEYRIAIPDLTLGVKFSLIHLSHAPRQTRHNEPYDTRSEG